jgi:hypothetical protein
MDAEQQPGHSRPPTTFKVCPMCDHAWIDRSDFLADTSLNFNGYQADFENEGRGLFYFTHETKRCGSTMTIEAAEFLSLYNGRRYELSRQLSEECPRYCLESSKLQRCPSPCRHAFVREISELLLARKRP